MGYLQEHIYPLGGRLLWLPWLRFPSGVGGARVSGCGVAWLPLATLATFAPEPPRGARPQELLGAFLGSRCPVMDERAGTALQAPQNGSQGRSEASGDASLAPTAVLRDGMVAALSG